MRDFQDTFETRKRSVISAFSICMAVPLKGNSRDVSVSIIIVRTDDSNLSEKGCEVNAHLTEMCKERKLNLINHPKKIKTSHVN